MIYAILNAACAVMEFACFRMASDKVSKGLFLLEKSRDRGIVLGDMNG